MEMEKELNTINATDANHPSSQTLHGAAHHDHNPSSQELRGAGHDHDHTHEAPSVKKSMDPTYWRSMDQLADTPEYQEFLHREFPAGASELQDPVTRRNFHENHGRFCGPCWTCFLPHAERSHCSICKIS
jgi:MoCo/4Fe-4S cofactor protein with predicted Tat translocation signal